MNVGLMLQRGRAQLSAEWLLLRELNPNSKIGKRVALSKGLWVWGLMLKQPDPTLHKTTPVEITSLFGDAKLMLDETPKAISPFGGRQFHLFPGPDWVCPASATTLALGRTDFQQRHPAGPLADRVYDVRRVWRPAFRPLRVAAGRSGLAGHAGAGALSQ
jgi:hypothetical protein